MRSARPARTAAMRPDVHSACMPDRQLADRLGVYVLGLEGRVLITPLQSPRAAATPRTPTTCARTHTGRCCMPAKASYSPSGHLRPLVCKFLQVRPCFRLIPSCAHSTTPFSFQEQDISFVGLPKTTTNYLQATTLLPKRSRSATCPGRLTRTYCDRRLPPPLPPRFEL